MSKAIKTIGLMLAWGWAALILAALILAVSVWWHT